MKKVRYSIVQHEPPFIRVIGKERMAVVDITEDGIQFRVMNIPEGGDVVFLEWAEFKAFRKLLDDSNSSD